MARKDGFVRLVNKFLPLGASPSIPTTDDHTDGTWTYTDIYDREITINDLGQFFYRAGNSIFELTPGASGGSASNQNLFQTLINGNSTNGVNIQLLNSSIYNGDMLFSLDSTTGINLINDTTYAYITNNEINVGGATPSFPGILYTEDYSANYTDRSLVDKGYVLNAIASATFSGGGATPSLSQVLSTGNTTNGNNIELTGSVFSGESDYILAQGNAISGGFNFEYNTGTTWYPRIIAESGGDQAIVRLTDTEALIQTSRNVLGTDAYTRITTAYDAINLSTNDLITLDGITHEITSTTHTISASHPTFEGIRYDQDYSANFTNHSLVDKQYVDTKIAGITASTGITASSFLVEVRNQSGSTIHKGKVIYISGSTGNKPLISLAQANAESTSARTFGVVSADIADNADGTVVVLGSITTLDTRTTATNPFTTDTLVDGDRLYLSPTDAGYVTNVKPYAPNHMVYIGTVIRTSPTNGYIEYQIQNGFELEELHNVQISATPSNGQVLGYESSTNLWKPTTVLSGSGVANQVTFWNGTNTITGDSKLTFQPGIGGSIFKVEQSTNNYIQLFPQSASNELGMVKDGGYTIISMDGTDAIYGNILSLKLKKDSITSPNPLVASDTIANIVFSGTYQAGNTNANNGADIQVVASETWSATASGSTLRIRTNKNNSGTTGTQTRIEINGNAKVGNDILIFVFLNDISKIYVSFVLINRFSAS